MKFKIINSDKRLYKLNIPVIGLTGGVATGKSTVSQILRQNNLFSELSIFIQIEAWEADI